MGMKVFNILFSSLLKYTAFLEYEKMLSDYSLQSLGLKDKQQFIHI